MIDLNKFIVTECSLADVKAFVEQWHYTHSLRGVTVSHVFRLDCEGELIGAAIYGKPVALSTLNKYSENGKYRVTELRRFCLADKAQYRLPNGHASGSASKFLSVTMKKLWKTGMHKIISFADPKQGHEGVIYKATGFALQPSGSKRTVYKLVENVLGSDGQILLKAGTYPPRNLDQYASFTSAKAFLTFCERINLDAVKLLTENKSRIKKWQNGKFVLKVPEFLSRTSQLLRTVSTVKETEPAKLCYVPNGYAQAVGSAS